MSAYHLFATSMRPLALNEMLVVEVIISDGWTRVTESALLKRQPVVADAVWALAYLHEQWKSIGYESTLIFPLSRLGFDTRSRPWSLDAVTLGSFAFVTKIHHELDSFNSLLENLIFCQAVRLMAQNVRELRSLWNMYINLRLDVLFLLTLCLALNILGGAIIEVVFTVFFDNLLVTLRSFYADLVEDLPNLFFILAAFDPIFALFQLCSLLFKSGDLWVRCQIGPDFIGHHVRSSTRVTCKANVRK